MRTYKYLSVLSLLGVLSTHGKQNTVKSLVQSKAELQQQEIILDIIVDDVCCSENGGAQDVVIRLSGNGINVGPATNLDTCEEIPTGTPTSSGGFVSYSTIETSHGTETVTYSEKPTTNGGYITYETVPTSHGGSVTYVSEPTTYGTISYTQETE